MAARPDAYAHRVVIAVSIAAFAILLVLAVWASMHMLLLIFGGILLAVLLRALGDALSRHTRVPENWAVWIVLAAIVAVLATGGVYLSGEITEQFDELGRGLTAAWDQFRGYLERFGWGQQVLSMLGDPQVSEDKVGALGKLFAAVVGGVSGLVISVFIGLYVAADPNLYRRGFLRLTPMRFREHVGDILDQLHDTLRAWLLGTLVLMVIVGTMTGIGLWALGIPLAFALGIIAFFLEFIPYVGPILAAIPAVLIASSVGGQEVLFVLLLYWGVQSIEGYLLSPLVYQQSANIPPMLTISAQVVLGTLLGVIGIIFATPLTACFMVLVQRLYVEDALGDKLDRPLKASTR
jgi:predicted PurR-regulated permease PerM